MKRFLRHYGAFAATIVFVLGMCLVLGPLARGKDWAWGDPWVVGGLGIILLGFALTIAALTGVAKLDRPRY